MTLQGMKRRKKMCIRDRYSPVIPAVAYYGKQERGAFFPVFRVTLPDVFTAGSILQGNELGARGVNDNSCFGIRKCNKHGLVLFSWHCMFMFLSLIHI